MMFFKQPEKILIRGKEFYLVALGREIFCEFQGMKFRTA